MGYGNDHSLTSLINRTRIHILPVANPDGAEEAVYGECSSEKGKFNANGKDLAQDFPGEFSLLSLLYFTSTKTSSVADQGIPSQIETSVSRDISRILKTQAQTWTTHCLSYGM